MKGAWKKKMMMEEVILMNEEELECYEAWSAWRL